MNQKLEEINKVIQNYLQEGESAFRVMNLFENGSRSGWFYTLQEGIEKRHEHLHNERRDVLKSTRKLFSEVLEEYGEMNGISILTFKKGQEAEFKNLSLSEIIEYIVKEIRNEMRDQDVIKMQNISVFSKDEINQITAESKSSTFIGDEIKYIDYCFYTGMDSDCEILNNKLGSDLKTIMFEVTNDSYTIYSDPVKPELGWNELTEDCFEVSAEIKKRKEAIDESIKLRTEHYNSFGKVFNDVYAPLLGPIFSGGKEWPGGRPQYRVIKTDKSTVIITDGLSNCFERKSSDKELQYNGYAIELYFEFQGNIPFEDFNNHYSIDLLTRLSQNAVNAGHFNATFLEYGPVSIEFTKGSFNEEYQNEDGKYIILMNTTSENIPAKIKLNKEEVILAGCKILPVKHFDKCCMQGSKNMREELNNSYIQDKEFCYNPFNIDN